MRKRIIIVGVMVLAMAHTGAFSQEDPGKNIDKGKRERQTDLFLNFSDKGTGVGVKFFYDMENRDTKFGIGFLITGVRGEKEYVYYDPYNPYIFPEKRGTDFVTMIIPLTVSLKREMFRESIESSLRPFIIVEAGPVYGIAFPRIGGFINSFKKGKGQISAGVFSGIGVEFGDETVYGFTLGYHYIRFPKTLGERKDYAGIDIRFSILSMF